MNHELTFPFSRALRIFESSPDIQENEKELEYESDIENSIEAGLKKEFFSDSGKLSPGNISVWELGKVYFF